MSSILALVRHGQSEWNLQNRFTGWVDVALTELGQQEAKRAGQQLAAYKFDVCFSSGLQRAQNTLKLILEQKGATDLPVHFSDALNERMYGDLQGLDKAETAQKFGDEQVKLWRRSWDVAPPNGESLKDTLDRVLPYYENSIRPELEAGRNVLVAAHGNSLRALIMHLEGLSPEQILEFEIPTAVPRIYELTESLKIEKAYFLS